MAATRAAAPGPGRRGPGSSSPAGSEPTDYSSYLLIDDLLHLQRPITPGAHDELLFIVVHQAYELWFKLVLHELGLARRVLLEGRPQAAIPPLTRVVAVDRLLEQQLGVLETMTPEGFLAFRDPLAPASGFQSTQFREIEILCGRLAPGLLDTPALDTAARDHLRARAGEPTLWAAFCACGRRGGLDLPDGDAAPEHARRLAALAALHHDHDEPWRAALHQVAERLVDHDEAFACWRFRHARMAEREIGARSGTGGSPGVAYLRSTVDAHLFPELWEVRSHL